MTRTRTNPIHSRFRIGRAPARCRVEFATLNVDGLGWGIDGHPTAARLSIAAGNGRTAWCDVPATQLAALITKIQAVLDESGKG